MKKGFALPVYDNKHVKTKVKSFDGKASTNLNDNHIPDEGKHCVFLSMIILDAVVKMGLKYYPQVNLEDCKYTIKQNMIWISL